MKTTPLWQTLSERNENMRLRRVIIFSLTIIFSLSLIIIAAFYFLVNASLPVREGILKLNNVDAQIRIIFDKKGIPQIYAENEKDVWFAVGWLHASDRLFQMETVRRVADGRLSEWFGELTLKYDRQQRLINHRKIVTGWFDLLEEKHAAFLQSYVNGINSWAEHTAALPFEFYLLGSEFKPWEVDDVLMLFSFQTWFSNILQYNDPFHLLLEKKLGKEAADEMIVPYPQEAPKTAVKSSREERVSVSPGQILEGWPAFFIKSIFSAGSDPFSLTRASNAWTISPRKSLSGSAILANDPHLDLSRLPQFWYVLGIHTLDGTLDAAGISTPGIPAIVMGYNRQTAWAFTAGGIDITDEYIEKINPENPGQYLYKDRFINFEERYEYVHIRGRSEVDTLRVKTTKHGPVIEESEDGNEVYAMHWAGLDFHPARAVASGFELLKMSDFQSFRKLVTNFAALDANWIYADKEGNIGYQLGTPLPVRLYRDTYSRLPGWEEQYNWKGYHPLDETPYAYNPPQGWLASCNNKPAAAIGHDPLPGNFADGRIRRISDLLSVNQTFSIKNMMQFQMDDQSLILPAWNNEIVRLLDLLGEQIWIERIRNWMGTTGVDSKAAALVGTWLAYLNIYIFEDEFPDQISNFLNPTINRERNLLHFYFTADDSLFDDIRTTERQESKEDIALKAMKEAINIVGDKNWGAMQSLTMAHPMARIPILSSLLGLEKGPFARAGTRSSLNNSTGFWQEEEYFLSRGGPSWRFIYDFNEMNQAWIIIPAGQSGHPSSPHFFDFYEMWEKGEYWTLTLNKMQIEEMALSRLILQPLSVKNE